MTDLELLEKAAKAAGLRVIARKPETYAGCLVDEGGDRVRQWNPLTDDGDALRLAVQLLVRLDFDRHIGAFFARWLASDGHPREVCEMPGQEPYAATRRVIVRAAAAMAEK